MNFPAVMNFPACHGDVPISSPADSRSTVQVSLSTRPADTPAGGVTSRTTRAHKATASVTAVLAAIGAITRQDSTSACKVSTLTCLWSKVPLMAKASRKPSSTMSRIKRFGTASYTGARTVPCLA